MTDLLVPVAVLAGGRSPEHAISLLSAKSVVAALREFGHEVACFVMNPDGQFLNLQDSEAILNAQTSAEVPSYQYKIPLSFAEAITALSHWKVVFPVIHGPFGEDGRLQGFLEYCHLPYVGCHVLSSAICMDKAVTKAILTSHGIDTPKYRLITRAGFMHNPRKVLQILDKISLPFFIKPANLGSSLGISKVEKHEDIAKSLMDALGFDDRVLVEQAITPVRELEVAVLGNQQSIACTLPGEITYDAAMYDFATKYTPGKAQLHIPADIPQALQLQIMDMAKRAFKLFACSGMARIDFFYQPQRQRLYLNELNTIPGFTNFSMYAKLWEHQGLSYQALCHHLVNLALCP